jgi:hypothetical protein
MLQFIIPSVVIAGALIARKLMLYYGERNRVRKMIKDALKECDRKDVLTEYHDTKYTAIWPLKSGLKNPS